MRKLVTLIYPVILSFFLAGSQLCQGSSPGEWWNSSWKFRKAIKIFNNHPSQVLDSTYTVVFELNIEGPDFLDNGNDIRVVFQNSIELDRINHLSLWNSPNTKVAFRLKNAIPPFGADTTNYFVYYGNPYAGNPLSDGGKVYLFWDDFETDLSKWSKIQTSSGTIQLTQDRAFCGSKSVEVYQGVDDGDLVLYLDVNSLKSQFGNNLVFGMMYYDDITKPGNQHQVGLAKSAPDPGGFPRPCGSMSSPLLTFGVWGFPFDSVYTVTGAKRHTGWHDVEWSVFGNDSATLAHDEDQYTCTKRNPPFTFPIFGIWDIWQGTRGYYQDCASVRKLIFSGTLITTGSEEQPPSTYTINFPFPQHVTYKHGTKPEVNQDTMDQNVLNTFNDWLDSFVTSDGCPECPQGTYRVKSNSVVIDGVQRDNFWGTVSEGIGSGMLITVLMSNRDNDTKKYFDGFWRYYKHYSSPPYDSNGLMSWVVEQDGTRPKYSNGQTISGSATDADEDVALSLLMAYEQWGDTSYLNSAITLIKRINHNEVEPQTNVLRPGDQFGGTNQTNPSYFSPAWYLAFKTATCDANWGEVTSSSYRILRKFYDMYSTGLVPKWTTADGTPATNNAEDFTYEYDACRTPLRITLDYLFNGPSNNELAGLLPERISNWFLIYTGGDPDRVGGRYTLEGNRLSCEICDNAATFVGPVAVASMTSASSRWRSLLYDRLWRYPNDQYYATSLKLLSQLILSGNFWDVNEKLNKKLIICAKSPVDLKVTTPTGRIITKSNFNSLLEDYMEIGVAGHVDDEIVIDGVENGAYKIEVIPESGAGQDSTYSLLVGEHGIIYTLAKLVRIAEKPVSPYSFLASQEAPDSVKCQTVPSSWYLSWLKSTTGTIRCQIGNFPSGYDASKVDPTPVRLNGYLGIFGGKYRILSSLTGFTGNVLEVAFDRAKAIESLDNPQAGKKEQIYVTGNFTDGRKFVAYYNVNMCQDPYTSCTMTAGSFVLESEIEESPLPSEFSLSNNYPNPFNLTTQINYALPKDAEVRLDIYNIMGQRVRTLVNEPQTAGYKNVIWDGKNDSGDLVASGVYFYRIKAGEFIQSRKMVLLK